MSHNVLRDAINRLPEGKTVLLISDDGQKGHVALRMLVGAGIEEVYNLSGGYVSLERYARAIGYSELNVGLYPMDEKSVVDLGSDRTGEESSADDSAAEVDTSKSGPLIVDVRTPMEFDTGAYPGAININLDDLASRVEELGSRDREIVLYCASGARSAYGQRILKQMGFTNVRNAGGLQDIMATGV
jgi:rhodanese-related sulfurtransferase